MSWRNWLKRSSRGKDNACESGPHGQSQSQESSSPIEFDDSNYEPGEPDRETHRVREVDAQRVRSWLLARELAFEEEPDEDSDGVIFRLPFAADTIATEVIKVIVHLSGQSQHLRVLTYARTESNDRASAESAASEWNHRRLWPTCYTFLDHDSTVVLAGESSMTVVAGASDSQLDNFMQAFISSGIEMVNEGLEAMQQFGDLFPPEDQSDPDSSI